MADLVLEWAGKERHFRLAFGGVLDLEEAIGEGIGHVFQRVTVGRFGIKDVYHTIRLGLIGGGLSVVNADRLMKNHFDTRPYMDNARVAGAILADLMIGVEEEDEDQAEGGRDVPPPHKFSEISQICNVFNMSPQDLRALRYADFVNLVRGFNAGSKQQADFISEDEFLDILDRYEPEAVN
ncbi:gene transfer agent family protein [Phaeobacter sp. 22II1-1F12B]|uniref:gene transfer agent family protein n=1 Tax=Phaeobacter sp. 22II1-1F12B TaxID=1317111 RepID=UPI000B521A07|nr:gene transfer agent family protein [Phaeobacter sp. 22II1-1F12B]